MKITISGATGLVGEHLRLYLALQGHDVHCLSRRPPAHSGWHAWDPVSGPPPRDSLEGAGAVIHLAGEPVARRWNDEVKRRIRASRELGTRNLVAALAALPQKPGVLVSASAIGYYGDRGDEVLSEQSAPGAGFLSEVCVEWERAAREAEALGIRVVCLRIGIVLAPNGGALTKMLPPFRFGLGGPIGGGQAWMSWIHTNDLTRLFEWAVDHPTLRGPVNAVAPGAVQNVEFTRILGRVLRRPAVFPVPAAALRLLYGEMAGVVLASQRVEPRAAVKSGFEFSWPDLDSTLRNLIS
jgi:uncharacterized protein (TIGR01777 family)